MAKALNIDLNVNANTSQARQELSQLQNTLKQLTTASGEISKNLTTGMDLSKTIAQVTQLRTLLQSATNVDTGVLNFTKLNQSIQQANTSLLDYGRTLNSLGPTGQKAFQQLATAVSKSEIPISQTNGMLKQFGTTMKNTLRWQASSMLLHGTVNAIQKAWNYAQKLDRSLTDIQIVTKQSDAQMAKFAESANKAARALSTSTTAYTDAALIYYQQGLNDAQVKQRTDVTVKMANVTGRTAEKVSDQMTAIWNNFDNGSKSLEYYADVITALGAATASSSDEIATGLSKFAAVADTVGLSYENATAALATITATTRQSADSVGNGLKTLFSRLQSLSLGQTLEDGVNLTKYTKALNTVGVSALDAAGNLRSMDSILADLGERWGTLSTAQQNALAQTVGGVRQYVTFTALMDNYDFFKDNIQIAKSAAGELQKQADVYDKSWAAARKHVQASAEAIYSDLIDDKFFTGLTNGFAGLLHQVDNLIDGIGGIKGVLLTAGTAFATFNKQGTQAFIQNTMNGIQTLLPGGVERLQQLRSSQIEEMTKMIYNPDDLDQYANEVERATAQGITRQLRMQEQFTREQNTYSPLQMMYAQQQMADMEVRNTEVTSLAQKIENLDNQIYDNLDVLRQFQTKGTSNFGNKYYNMPQGGDIIGGYQDVLNSNAGKVYSKLLESGLQNADWGNLDNTAIAIKNSLVTQIEELDPTIANLLKNASDKNAWRNVINEAQLTLRDIIGTSIDGAVDTFGAKLTPEQKEKFTRLVIQDFETRGNKVATTTQYNRAAQEAQDRADQGILQMPQNFTAAQGMTEAISMLGGLGMGLSILKSGFSNLSNPNMSGADKFLSIATSIGMATPMLSGVGRGIQNSGLLQWLGSGADDTAIGNALIKRGQTVQNNVIEQEMQRIAQQRLDSKMYGTRFGSTKGILANYGDDIRAEAMANYGTLPGGNTMNAGLRAISRGRGNSLTTRLANNKTVQQIGLKLGMGGKAATDAIANNDTALAGQLAGQGMAGGLKAMAIMAAIAGLVAIGKQIEAAIETPTEKIERLNTELANTKTNAQEAQESYNTLINSTSTRAKALETLKELDRTTIEYKQTVQQANAASREIIDQANLVKDRDYKYDKNGIIQFTNEETLKKAQEAQYDKVVAANNRVLAAQAVLSNYQTKVDYNKVLTAYSAVRTDIAEGGFGYDIGSYENVYNNNATLNEIADQYNLGSAANVVKMIQDGTLQREMMNANGAAASNQALLTDIATNLSTSGKINDLQQLAINTLSDSVDFQKSLNEANDKGLKNTKLWGRTVQWYKDRYEEEFGPDALREFTTSQTFLSANKSDQEILLRDAIGSERSRKAAEDAYKETLKQLQSSTYAGFYNSYENASLQNIRDQIGQNFIFDEDGNYTLSNVGKQLSEVEQQYQLTILDEYKNAFEGVSQLGAAAGFGGQTNVQELSKLNIAQLKQVQALGNQYKQQFGDKGLGAIYADLIKDTNDFRTASQELVGDDAVQTLFNLNEKGFKTQYEQLRTEIGDKGLFEALYDSDGFKDSLESLNKEFEKMGTISASSVLEAADASKTLSNYLDLSGTNAKGLADTIAALASGDVDINRLSNSLVKAYSATGIVASNLAESYKYIDEYQKGTSIETIPNFYESLEGTIYKGVKAGNIMDEPVLNAVQAILGTEGRQRWMLDAAKASGMGFTTGNQWMLNESASASQWKTISQIYKTGNMQPIFAELFNGTLEGFDLDQEINDVKLSDVFRYGNGEIQTYLGDKGKKFTDAFKTQEDFIQFLLRDNVLGQRYSEETIRNAVSEYTNKNEALNLAWTTNGIIEGAKELVNVDQVANADNLRKFLTDNSLLIGAMADEQRNELAKTLGIDVNDLQFENGKLKVDETVAAVTRGTQGSNLVNLAGLNYETADYEAIKAAYEDRKNGNTRSSFEDYLLSGINSTNLIATQASNINTNQLAVNTQKALSLSEQDELIKLLGIPESSPDLMDNEYWDSHLDYVTKLIEEGLKGNEIALKTLGYENAEDLKQTSLINQDLNLQGYDFDQIMTNFMNLGFAAGDVLTYLGQSGNFGTIDNGKYLTRQVWDQTANEGKGGWTTEVQDTDETVEHFQERTGGTQDERMAEWQHQQAIIDAANAQIIANNIANGAKGEAVYEGVLNDILTATGKIQGSTEAVANAATNQATASTGSGGVPAITGMEEPTEGTPEAELGQGEGANVEAAADEQNLTVTSSPVAPAQVQPPYAPPAEKPDLHDIPFTQLTFDQIQQLWNEQSESSGNSGGSGGSGNPGGSGGSGNPGGSVIPDWMNIFLNRAASGQNNHIPGFASGYQGPATVGELGPETWIHDGQMDIVGQKGRETIWVNPSDTILTAGQTDRLLGGYKPGFAEGDGWYGAYKPTGGGGGARRGSGSGGKKEDDDEKWKDSWEPYHEISREVQRLTTDVENLNTEMERAFGVEKIQKMDEELELLDQRLQQEADYIAEAEKYIAEYAEYLPDGTEVVDGVIQNYDALQEKYLKDIYQAQEDRDKDKLEKLQREWQKIQQYEQHTDKLEERRQEQLNLLYQKADLMLQQLQYSIDQVNSSLDESESLIDYMLNHMNTDMFKMAESIALVGDATDVTIQKMEQAKQSIQDYEDMLGGEYANDEELVNRILKERNNLLKLNQELDKQRDNVIKKLTYTIQEFNNEQKKATKLLTNYNTLIKNYTDLSELMGLSTINNTEQIDKLNDALKNNMGLNIQATKSQLETNQAQIAQMEADFEANPWMREEYDDVYQKLIEEGQGLSVTLSNNLQSMLNFIVKEFETELDRALTSFQDQITKGFGTWDELTSAANSLKGAQDVNTKAYDRVYQLNTLIRDMDSYMNDMTSAKNHNSILKFQEQIKKLKADNTDQSQKELDVLRAQFELMQAQFDLEDAQNAKNQVRLQRDMNGNWGYVYTADEDAMAEAQQNVDDKLKAYLDAVTALQTVQGEYMSTVAELEIQEQELRNELNQLGHTDEDEERRAQLLKQIAAIEEQQDMYKNNLLRMQGTLNEAVESGHGYIQEIWDESNELFNASLGALPQMMLEGIATTEDFFAILAEAENKFVERTDTAKNAYMEQYEEWAPYLEAFNDGLGDMAANSQQAVDNLDALNEQYLSEFSDAMEAAVKWEQEYGKEMENVIKQNLEFIDQLDRMINGLRDLTSMDYSVSFRRVTDTSETSAMNSFDSGGYTGAWGTSGKIAMLHEKEQVFNAQDTQNLLTAAQILRTIDASANSMAIGLNNMITPKIDGVTQQVDQTVNISASFPNAVNHFEIEEAFNNLTNKAVQFANRKNA